MSTFLCRLVNTALHSCNIFYNAGKAHFYGLYIPLLHYPSTGKMYYAQGCQCSLTKHVDFSCTNAFSFYSDMLTHNADHVHVSYIFQPYCPVRAVRLVKPSAFTRINPVDCSSWKSNLRWLTQVTFFVALKPTHNVAAIMDEISWPVMTSHHYSLDRLNFCFVFVI